MQVCIYLPKYMQFRIITSFRNFDSLLSRRQRGFRMTNYNLRRVLNPTLQEPFCPPRPKLPEASVLESSYLTDLTRLTSQQKYTDLIFLCGTVGFSAHRFVMAAASPLLRRILTTGNSTSVYPTLSTFIFNFLSGEALLIFRWQH